MEKNSDSKDAVGFGLVEGQRMSDEKTKDMDKGKRVMVLTCGSEEIIIEANDVYSDDSEFTDPSSCSSDSDYEEIEVNLPTKATKQCSDNTFLNPYVKLVRCDHLVTKMSSTVDTTVNDRFQSRKSNDFRYSPRKRRPNCTYNSDEFLLFDYTLISKPKAMCQRKKKVSKRAGKACPTADKGCFTRKFPTRLEGSKFSGDYDSLNIPGFNSNVVSNAMLNPNTALSENIKLEFLNDEGFHNDTNDFATSVHSFSFLESNETSTEPRINTIIKSEPIDEYFEGMTDNYFNQSSSTVRNEYPLYRVKNERFDDTFICNETEYTEELPDENVGVNIKPKYKQQMIDAENGVRKMKAEKHIESSDSEVDVVNDWEGPVFILDSEVVAFDHPYAFSCDTVLANNISRNAVLTNPKINGRHSASTVLHGTITGRAVKSSKKLLSRKTTDKSPPSGRNVKCSSFSFSTASTDKSSSSRVFKKGKDNTSKTTGSDSVVKEVYLRQHNKLERFRRKCMADSFKELRDTIPKLVSNDRASKQEILNSAVTYIRQLEQTELILKTALRVLNEKHAELTKIHDRAVAHI